jgi:hypothetical protein
MNIENTKKVIKSFFTNFFNLLKKVWNYLEKINFSLIRKIVGVSLMVVSGLIIFLETIMTVLFSADPFQLEKIMFSLFYFNLFDYINLTEYYLILVGGYFVGMVFFGLLILLAVWIYNGKFFLKKFKLRILILTFFTAGSTILAYGMYYALPEVKEPIERVMNNHYKCGHEKIGVHSRRGGEMHKENGYQEKFYFNDLKNQKIFEEEFFRSFLK